jgi:hypothetical protein
MEFINSCTKGAQAPFDNALQTIRNATPTQWCMTGAAIATPFAFYYLPGSYSTLSPLSTPLCLQYRCITVLTLATSSTAATVILGKLLGKGIEIITSLAAPAHAEDLPPNYTQEL